MATTIECVELAMGYLLPNTHTTGQQHFSCEALGHLLHGKFSKTLNAKSHPLYLDNILFNFFCRDEGSIVGVHDAELSKITL